MGEGKAMGREREKGWGEVEQGKRVKQWECKTFLVHASFN